MFSAFENKNLKILLAIIACGILSCASAHGQRPRFDDFFASQGNGAIAAPPQNLPPLPGAFPGRLPGNPNSIITTPPVQLNPPPGMLQGFPGSVAPNGNQIFDGGPYNGGRIIPGGVVPNGAIGTGVPGGTGIFNGGTFNGPTSGPFAAPTFDPYRTPNQTFPIFPRATQPIIQQPLPQRNFQPVPPPNANAPRQFNQPALPQYNPGQFNPQQYQFPQAPNRWPYEGTGTNWLPSVDWTWPQEAWGTFRTKFLPRVLERPRARQTYLQGNNGNELNINDIEIATTATIPNAFGGNQPLRISPGFIFHFWDGPDSAIFPSFDLPSRAYSSYLSFDHMTDPRRDSGLEGNFTVGYYSDFDNTSSDAIRLTSKTLGWRRLNPYTVAKLGVEYLDRVDVKLLPAAGLYMTPNADMKLDLYFPKTKLAHRIPNIGNLEAWAYVGAEYGGGSWAIRRRDGSRDQADINDVRAFLGTEWIGPRRVTGFFEFGYAFDREIVYRSNALNKLDLQDTLMIRSGIAF